MSALLGIVKELDKREGLENRELCYLCLLSGIQIQDSLHSEEDMSEGPHSSDSMCPHCYDTEKEFGHMRLRKRDQWVWKLIREFNECREQYLKTKFKNRKEIKYE